MKPYWFKPKRFWGWFAAYYPVSVEGWVISIAFCFYFIWQLTGVLASSYVSVEALLTYAIHIGIAFIVFDIITRMFGEYPSWWRRKWRWFRK